MTPLSTPTVTDLAPIQLNMMSSIVIFCVVFLEQRSDFKLNALRSPGTALSVL